jgi:hypothetical protein
MLHEQCVRGLQTGKATWISTPFPEEHGLIFNQPRNLIICRSRQEGLPLCSVPEHLMATELSRWDNFIGEKVSITINHSPVSPMKSGSAAAKALINQLAQSLINGGYISSKGNILDAGSTAERVEKFSSLPDNLSKRYLFLMAGLTTLVMY